MNRMRRLVTGPRMIGFLIACVAAIAIGTAMRAPPIDVDIASVSRGPITVTVDELAEGRVSDLFVVSAPVSGALVRVPLKPGAKVVAGRTVLGRIQPGAPTPLDARTVAEAYAQIERADAQQAEMRARVARSAAERKLAASELARAEQLAARGFVSRATLERARTAELQTKAAEAEAAQALDAARHALAAARAAIITRGPGSGTVAILAPVSGHVLTVPQESARYVTAGTPILEIGNPTKLELVADYLSADAVRIPLGAEVEILDWGGSKPLRGRVRLIEPFGFTKVSALGVEEQRVNVIIDLTDPWEDWMRLGHGYRATVKIKVAAAADAVRVPVGALFRLGTQWAVFVVEGDRARLTRIDVKIMNDELAQVTSGLKPGARVILHPSEKVIDGVRVRGEVGRP